MKAYSAPLGSEAPLSCSKKSIRHTLLLLILTCAVFLPACSTLGGKKNDMKNLTKAVEAFNTALRWGDFKMASALVAPALQEQFWQQSDILEKNIRLTEYDIRNISMAAEGQSTPVIVRYRYYYTNNPQLRTVTVRQDWHYSEVAEGWQLTHTGLDALTGQ